MNNSIIINGSLSCIDLLHIEAQMKEIDASSITGLHYDVVDGEFNQCFIFGDCMLKTFRALTDKTITVHLAVNDVNKYIEPMIQAGANALAIHYESPCDHFAVFEKIRSMGAKPVLAFRAETEVPDDFEALAQEAEWILKLMVNPGFAGQKIQPQALNHIRQMKERLVASDIDRCIEADGNIHAGTVRSVVDAGATILTGGTSGLFNDQGTMEENIRRLLEAAYE